MLRRNSAALCVRHFCVIVYSWIVALLWVGAETSLELTRCCLLATWPNDNINVTLYWLNKTTQNYTAYVLLLDIRYTCMHTTYC